MGEKGINGTRGEMGQKGEMVSWDQTCNICIKTEQKNLLSSLVEIKNV